MRLLRRIERDIQERGRTLQSVLEQYMRTVRSNAHRAQQCARALQLSCSR
jgi:uridine kinase